MRKTHLQVHGRPVTLDDRGIFHTVTAAGEKLKSPSLPALAKKVAEAGKFDSFPVLIDNYNEPCTSGTVVGVNEKDHYWPHCFRLANGHNTRRVILDTPDNRKKLNAMNRLRVRIRNLAAQRDAIEEALETRTSANAIVAVKE